MTGPGDIAISASAVFDGARLRPGDGFVLGRDGTVRRDTGPRPSGPSLRIDGVLAPGYLDLQVNGGGGVLFNQTPTAGGLATIAAAHRRLGTTAILPTLITDAPGVLEAAAGAVCDVWGEPGIAGIHIEGPHISVARRGTHEARFVRPLDEATLSVVASLRDRDIPVMITVAPETVRPDQITRLAATGAVVSLGHSDATAEVAQAAMAAGARCATHLFNAMSQMQNRAPGVVGAVINSDIHAGIICDGIHVADDMVALALRARPAPDRMFLVSDAMPTVGGPDSFALYGRKVRLSDGRLLNSEGALAGAHTTMAESVARLVTVLSLPPEQALRMAVTVPARVIGRPDLAALEGRAADDVLVLGPDWRPTGTLAGVAAQPGPGAVPTLP